MKGKNQMRKSLGFTLAEVLITLAIIGVVAAMTIPSVIINTNQQEYKTGLKKAVSVLNQAITMNMALEGLAPSDTIDEAPENTYKTRTLMNYLGSRLNVIKQTNTLEFGGGNAAFYTADGMRFEFNKSAGGATGMLGADATAQQGACTSKTPCIVLVDVNGDRKPNPSSANAAAYDLPKATDTRINDMFHIMITESAATPLGVVAQRTMFTAD